MSNYKWVYTNEELIKNCLDKIKQIPDDTHLFTIEMKVTWIKTWLGEIERISKREPLNEESVK